MGDINDIREKLRALPATKAAAGGDSAFSQEDKQLIEEVYQQLFGKGVRQCTCKHRYSDALFEILATLKLTRTMTEHKYRLKAGPVIWLGNDCYSRHNLTDEVAKKYLELHPDAVNLFEAIPEPVKKDSPVAEEAHEEALKADEAPVAEEAPKAEESKKKTKKTKD